MSTIIDITIDEDDLRSLVYRALRELLGDTIPLKTDDIKIEVKSTQNYKAEWETARFRASVIKRTPLRER